METKWKWLSNLLAPSAESVEGKPAHGSTAQTFHLYCIRNISAHHLWGHLVRGHAPNKSLKKHSRSAWITYCVRKLGASTLASHFLCSTSCGRAGAQQAGVQGCLLLVIIPSPSRGLHWCMAKNMLPLLLASQWGFHSWHGPKSRLLKEGRKVRQLQMLPEIFLNTFLNNHLLDRSAQVVWKPARLAIFKSFCFPPPQPELRSNYHLFNRIWLFASFSFRESLAKNLHQHEPNASRQAVPSQEGPGSSAPVIGHRIHSS